MKARKILTMVAALALTAAIAVGGTLAYLTSTATVENTFTVGKVSISMVESVVDEYGNPTGATTAQGNNNYKLLPGHSYTKNPTITVEKDSEVSYVRALVTIDKQAELDAIFASDGIALDKILTGTSNNWEYIGVTKSEDGTTRTYELRYKDKVDAREEARELDPVFTNVVVPGDITNEQLATIAGMTITVNAYAIQADGFANAEAAWAAYPAA